MAKPRVRVALAAGIAALMVVRVAGAADERDREAIPTLSVTGHGRVSAAPDVAEISVGVLTQGPTAREAMAANNEAMTALMDVLKERGVGARDVQTTQLGITPQYGQAVPAALGAPRSAEFFPKIVGYQVTNSVRVTAREILKLGQVLDAIVKAGGNQMHGITFRFDDPEALLDQARRKAMADARRKARLLAEEAGVVLLAPCHIREVIASPTPRPMMLHAMARGAMPADASMPVAAGEQELGITLDVSYRIAAPKE